MSESLTRISHTRFRTVVLVLVESNLRRRILAQPFVFPAETIPFPHVRKSPRFDHGLVVPAKIEKLGVLYHALLKTK